MPTNSNDRRWRAGYRAGVQDALDVLQDMSLAGELNNLGSDLQTVTTDELVVWLHKLAEREVKKLFLVNPRGPEEGAAKRYGLDK